MSFINLQVNCFYNVDLSWSLYCYHQVGEVKYLLLSLRVCSFPRLTSRAPLNYRVSLDLGSGERRDFRFCKNLKSKEKTFCPTFNRRVLSPLLVYSITYIFFNDIIVVFSLASLYHISLDSPQASVHKVSTVETLGVRGVDVYVLDRADWRLWEGRDGWVRDSGKGLPAWDSLFLLPRAPLGAQWQDVVASEDPTGV